MSFIEMGYKKGDEIYYAWHNKYTDFKKVYKLIISSVYDTVLIAWEDRGSSHMIGLDEKHVIFPDEYAAKEYLKGA